MRKKGKSEGAGFFKRLFARKIVILGAFLVSFFVLGAIFAPVLTPYDPYAQDLKNTLSTPSWEHWLGTDLVGRDVLTRILYGARTSLLIGVVAVLFAAAVGCTLGMISGYFGGVIRSIILRVNDAMMTIPSVMLALALSMVLSGGMTGLMIVLGISAVPGYVRMMHAQVLSVRESDYVSAAHVLGSPSPRIMARDILPNTMSALIVMITSQIGTTILGEAALSFLGFGVSAPTASWGAMISEGYPKMMNNPVFALVPGICILLLVLGFNLLGDGIRDALDPRLRGTL